MPLLKITSLTNPKVKRTVDLKNHRSRIRNGLTIVEGYQEIGRALAAGVKFQEFYVCGGCAIPAIGARGLKASGATFYETSEDVFEKMAYGDHTKGILGICQPRVLSLADLSFSKTPLLLIIEGIEKPGNLGAILRTADGAGIDGVIVCDEKTDLYNPNVIRASLGAIFSVKTVVSSSHEAYQFLKSKRIQICVSSPHAQRIYTQMDATLPWALVIGSEHDGVTDFWQRYADLMVKIPMRGAADSLNVASSAAILLYEVLRQRTARTDKRER